MSNLYMTLIEISDCYCRLRIAGMPEEELKIMKDAIIKISFKNKVEPLKLLHDCVIRYEEMAKVKSDEIESKIIKSELRQRGIEVD